MLALGPPKSTFNELMLQICCDAHFNVVVLVGNRFFAATGNINYAEEIKLVYTNDAHCITSEIIKFLHNSDVFFVKCCSQRQLGVTLALVKCCSSKELCFALVRGNKSTETYLLSVKFLGVVICNIYTRLLFSYQDI